jgi:hypothetical protein
MTTELRQLVYISDARIPISNKEIAGILESSRRSNPGRGITGLLLYCDGIFIQVLEGETEAVEQLYLVICGDPRHSNAEVLGDTIVADRIFGDWAMAYLEPSLDEAKTKVGLDGTLDRQETLRLIGSGETNTEQFLRNFAAALG